MNNKAVYAITNYLLLNLESCYRKYCAKSKNALRCLNYLFAPIS